MIRIDASALLRQIRLGRVKLATAVYAAVKSAAKLTSDLAKQGNFESDTGALKRSIRPVYESRDSARAEATARHAAWVERGNGFRLGSAKFIYPKRAPFLVFHIDGRKIVTRRVRTSKPRGYMAAARRLVAPLFVKMCNDAVKNMFR